MMEGLILNSEERENLIFKYPKIRENIKKFKGSNEIINGDERYCLWIEDNDLEYMMSIPEINRRIIAVKKSRVESKRSATNKLSLTPHRFGEVRHLGLSSIAVPSVSSENRDYIPMDFVDPDTIVSNLALSVSTNYIWLFGIVQSIMHMIWIDRIGGKLESRYRYSVTLVYNTFPFPPITPEQEAELTATALGILAAREWHPGSTLAELYDPEKMPENLREAHRANDLAVERCYRPEPFTSDEERLAWLFKLYEEMIAAEGEQGTLFAKQQQQKKKKTNKQQTNGKK